MNSFILPLMLGICLSCWNAFAGNEMGNGADNFSGDYGAAWFVGEDRIVTFCIDADPRFGRSTDQARADILAAWTKWLDYASAKGLYQAHLPATLRYPKSLSERPCDGKEDLRFKLGAEDTEVKQERARYERPSAISFRQSFDPAAGWGKGWIWFCLPGEIDKQTGFPSWRDDDTFRSILLHEIGHVFGNIHVNGTVMDRGLSQKIKTQQIKQEWVGKIDQRKELLSNGPTPIKTNGYLGGSGFFNRYRAFEWLMGRPAVGEMSAEYRRTSQLGVTELEVKDRQGSQVFTFAIRPGLYSPTYSSDVPVFKRMRDGGSISTFSMGQVTFGTLKHPTRGNVTALLESSMSVAITAVGPVGIKVLIDGVPQPLFEGFPEL